MTTNHFLFANVRGLRARALDLEIFAKENEVDILCLCETFLQPDSAFTLDGWSIIRKDRDYGNGGGVALLYRNDSCIGISQLPICSENPLDEILAVSITLQDNWQVILVVVYCPPHGQLPLNSMKSLLDDYERVIFVGDFNAHSRVLGSTITTSKGKNLVDFIEENLLILLNDQQQPTRYCPHSGRGEVLDLALATPTLLHKVEKCWIGEDIGSDHVPIMLSLKSGQTDNRPEPKLALYRANWQLYREELDRKLPENRELDPQTPENLDRMVEQVTVAMQDASAAAIPTCRPRRPGWIRLSSELKTVLKRRKSFIKLFRKTKDRGLVPLIQKEKRRFKRLVAHLRRENWLKYCNSLQKTSNANTRDFFRKWRQVVKGESCNKPNIPAIRINNSKNVTNERDKANLFANFLASKFKTVDTPEMDDHWKSEVENHVSSCRVDLQPLIRTDSFMDRHPAMTITLEQIIAEAAKLPNNKASGPDGLRYEMIKNGSRRLFQILLVLFQTSFDLGYVPKLWKVAKIVMLPKPAKDLKSLKGWRPVSMLNVLGKFQERFVSKSLYRIAEANNLFPNEQSGFRRNRETTEQVMRLADDALAGMDAGQVTTAVYLDIEGAFDCIWHDGLRYKLIEANLPLPMIRWFSDYIRGRNFTVNLPNAQSVSKHIDAGVPQGSCVSPPLFLLYSRDVDVANTTAEWRRKMGQYADDIAVWARSKSPKIAARLVQASLNAFWQWSCKWRWKVNPSKCQAITFSRRRNMPKERLTIGNQTIEYSEKAKYLGIIMDRRLNWVPQVNHVLECSRRSMGAVRAVCCCSGGPNADTVMTVYKALIESKILYGCPVLLSASDHVLARLEIIKNQAMRLALRLPRYVPSWYLRAELRTDTLVETLKKRATKFACRHLTMRTQVGEQIARLHQVNGSTSATAIARDPVVQEILRNFAQ